jgi:flagellar biosynthesis/type III secretory pathway M-ring protein FliF/YscJ
MIIFQVRNPFARAALILLPLIIFAVVYFTVIRPTNDTANDAVKSATQSATQQINQAKKNAPASAKGALDKASKLTACVSKAGTDAGDIQQCQVKFGG